jgi:hypothetical protein
VLPLVSITQAVVSYEVLSTKGEASRIREYVSPMLPFGMLLAGRFQPSNQKPITPELRPGLHEADACSV